MPKSYLCVAKNKTNCMSWHIFSDKNALVVVCLQLYNYSHVTHSLVMFLHQAGSSYYALASEGVGAFVCQHSYNSKTQKMSTEKSYTVTENRPMTIIAVEFWLNLGATHD